MMGGTQFVGRAFTESLLAAGHQVTHFNRGKTNPGLFFGVETISGDRNEPLEGIVGREWDAVIDVNSYLPHQTQRLNDALNDSVQQFIYVSTISVYDQGGSQRLPEDSPLLELKEDTGEVTAETYGPYKVVCERFVQERWGDKATILRPGVIVGPHDHTDRFAFWPQRVSEGGDMVVPADADHLAITCLDVRDFAAFASLCIERGVTGVFNVDRKAATFGDLRAALVQFASEIGSAVNQVEVPLDRLVDLGVRRWMEIPSLLPQDSATGDVSAATAQGLTERPIIDSVRDTWAWMTEEGRSRPLKAGLSVEQEAEVLRKWRDG